MRQIKFFLSILIVVLFTTSSIIGQKPYYSDFYMNWHEEKMKPDSVDHVLYLIGDAGEADFSKPTALKLLSSHLKDEKNKSTVVFLGDNIYPKGLPPEGAPNREDAIRNLEVQIEINKNHKGEIYFIPGNHDWDRMGKKGREAIQREEKYVEEALNSGNTFLPDNACPGPVEIELSKDVLLVLIDTQWWLHRWDKPYGDEDSCSSRNEFEFIEKLAKICKDNEDRQIVLAGHHPFYSNGSHGGYFQLKDHIFPLTIINKKLLLPLPVFGSILPLYRKLIGPRQDIPNPRYQLLKKEVLGAFEGHKNFVYAAGHEHSLQYYNKNDQHFIVSGSGSKATYAARKRGADFNISKQGFSKVIYMKSGETWIEYWTVSEDDENVGVLIFTKRIKFSDAAENFENEERLDFSDSTLLLAANESFKKGKCKQFFLGKHHRDTWTTPVEVEVFDMGAFEGGLTPIKLGGGMQTKSLRLKDKSGTQYIFRSVNKDPTKKFLPTELQNTWVSNFMKDQVSMSHPYGAVVVPDMAEAAGILHKKTKLVYIPDDPLLGEFRETYKNTLATLEVRASKNLYEYERFDNVKKAINTPDLVDELHDDNKNVVDEFDMLKNRLFDMIIGDFDRHDDQWRWAETKCGKEDHSRCFHKKDEKDGSGTVYRAIPRDRDQVFDHVDGLFPNILTLKWGPARLLRDFDYEIHDLVGLNLNGRQLDKSFLSSLTMEEWIDVANGLKDDITDEIIDKAVKNLPKESYDLQGVEIAAKLKRRRDDIAKYAKEYYLILAEKVNITGSDERELFEVYRMENGNTTVKVYRKDRDHSLMFKRVFKKDETKEIRLYALGSDDRIELFGNAKEGSIIRIIGGTGDDVVKDFSTVKGLRKLTKVYDEAIDTELTKSKETKDNTSDFVLGINEYERFKFIADVTAPIIKFGYNSDDKLFFGGGVSITKHGWRKTPYASKQQISARVAPSINGFQFLYEGDFYQISKSWNLHLKSQVLGPSSRTNFFGLGNETQQTKQDRTYYNLRYDRIDVSALFGNKISENQVLKIGPKYSFINVELDPTKFISTLESGLNASDFEPTNLFGLQVDYEINRLDHEVIPTKGFKFNLKSDWLYNDIKDVQTNNLSLDFQVVKQFKSIFKPTIAGRFGISTLFNDFAFYQANTLGAQNKSMGRGNLRGFQRDRYSGRTASYQNLDLRLDLFKFRSYLLPGQVGILGFVDNGRVWSDNENSDVWHQSYGGGVWFGVLKQFVLVSTFEKSDQNTFLNIYTSFFF